MTPKGASGYNPLTMYSLRRLVPVLALVLATSDCEPYGGPPDVVPTIVTVRDNTFDPPEMIVSPNTTVTWQWAADGMHNVTFNPANATDPTNSPTQAFGTFERRFVDLGKFDYYCTIHPDSMRGSVTVKPPLFSSPPQP